MLTNQIQAFSFRLPSDYIDDNEGVTYRYWRFTMKDFHGSTTLGGIMELELYEHAVGEETDDETTSEIDVSRCHG